ncbi:hypothetical protein Droror1_Dr00022007, partial [Drosera rotundifolia]
MIERWRPNTRPTELSRCWAVVGPVAGSSCCRKLMVDPMSEVVRERRERLGFCGLGGGLVGAFVAVSDTRKLSPDNRWYGESL